MCMHISRNEREGFMLSCPRARNMTALQPHLVGTCQVTYVAAFTDSLQLLNPSAAAESLIPHHKQFSSCRFVADPDQRHIPHCWRCWEQCARSAIAQPRQDAVFVSMLGLKFIALADALAGLRIRLSTLRSSATLGLHLEP